MWHSIKITWPQCLQSPTCQSNFHEDFYQKKETAFSFLLERHCKTQGFTMPRKTFSGVARERKSSGNKSLAKENKRKIFCCQTFEGKRTANAEKQYTFDYYKKNARTVFCLRFFALARFLLRKALSPTINDSRGFRRWLSQRGFVFCFCA